MAGGRLFQTRGPAMANALSASDVVVGGMSSIILAADREPGQPRPARRKSSARLNANVVCLASSFLDISVSVHRRSNALAA